MPRWLCSPPPRLPTHKVISFEMWRFRLWVVKQGVITSRIEGLGEFTQSCYAGGHDRTLCKQSLSCVAKRLRTAVLPGLQTWNGLTASCSHAWFTSLANLIQKNGIGLGHMYRKQTHLQWGSAAGAELAHGGCVKTGMVVCCIGPLGKQQRVFCYITVDA